MDELRVIKSIDEFLGKSGHPVTIICGSKIIEDVVHCQRVEGGAKADFSLIDSKGQNIFFISHKQSGFGHNGYGSLGNKAYPSRSPTKNPQIWEFMKRAREECLRMYPVQEDPNGIVKWKNSPYRGIWCVPPVNIQNEIIFGPDYGDKPSIHNCDIVAIGEPCFKSVEGKYELTFGDAVLFNGNPSHEKYRPILVVAGRIGQQEHVMYTVGTKVGIEGWLGAFPIWTIDELAKTKNLKKIEWPF